MLTKSMHWQIWYYQINKMFISQYQKLRNDSKMQRTTNHTIWNRNLFAATANKISKVFDHLFSLIMVSEESYWWRGNRRMDQINYFNPSKINSTNPKVKVKYRCLIIESVPIEHNTLVLIQKWFHSEK